MKMPYLLSEIPELFGGHIWGHRVTVHEFALSWGDWTLFLGWTEHPHQICCMYTEKASHASINKSFFFLGSNWPVHQGEMNLNHSTLEMSMVIGRFDKFSMHIICLQIVYSMGLDQFLQLFLGNGMFDRPPSNSNSKFKWYSWVGDCFSRTTVILLIVIIEFLCLRSIINQVHFQIKQWLTSNETWQNLSFWEPPTRTPLVSWTKDNTC